MCKAWLEKSALEFGTSSPTQNAPNMLSERQLCICLFYKVRNKPGKAFQPAVAEWPVTVESWCPVTLVRILPTLLASSEPLSPYKGQESLWPRLQMRWPLVSRQSYWVPGWMNASGHSTLKLTPLERGTLPARCWTRRRH